MHRTFQYFLSSDELKTQFSSASYIEVDYNTYINNGEVWAIPYNLKISPSILQSIRNINCLVREIEAAVLEDAKGFWKRKKQVA